MGTVALPPHWVVLVPAQGTPDWVYVLAILAAAPLSSLFAIVVHEAGHAICGRLAGVPIRRIQFGYGKIWASFWFGDLRIEIRHPSVFAGAVTVHGSLHATRAERFFFCSGGAFANLMAIVPLAWLVVWLDNELAAWVLYFAIFFQAITALYALKPTRGKSIAVGKPVSDGDFIRQALRESYETAETRRESLLTVLRMYAAPDDPPQRFDAAAMRVLALSFDPRKTDANERRYQKEEWARERARQHTRCELLCLTDGALSQMLNDGGVGDHEELDTWSAESVALRPDLKTLHGTRAGALATLGRFEEAKAEFSLADDSNLSDRFLNNAFLASTEFGLGDAAAGRRALEICFDIARSEPSLRLADAWRILQRVTEANGIAIPAAEEPAPLSELPTP